MKHDIELDENGVPRTTRPIEKGEPIREMTFTKILDYGSPPTWEEVLAQYGRDENGCKIVKADYDVGHQKLGDGK